MTNPPRGHSITWEHHLLKSTPSFWVGKVKDDDIQAELNRRGAQGWALTAVLDSNTKMVWAHQRVRVHLEAADASPLKHRWKS